MTAEKNKCLILKTFRFLQFELYKIKVSLADISSTNAA